jgi:uncharacterized damage-inducible protein DinB
MSGSILPDAFDHHAWATLRLIDACVALPPDQLATTVPGTYGSILDTLRHLVGSDASYLALLNGGQTEAVDEDTMGLPELRSVMERDGDGWASLVAGEVDPEAMVVRHRANGSESHAPLGLRLIQVLAHGTDHRSQISTALTTLGLTPPAIDLFDYAREHDRIVEIPAPHR